MDPIKLDEQSLELILNLVLNNLTQERELALGHHATLSTLLNGATGDEQLTGLEVQMMVQELSSALTGFLNSASLSTDKAIKVAKILSDLLSKMDADDTLTDADRADIESMVTGFEDEAAAVASNVVAITNPRNIGE